MRAKTVNENINFKRGGSVKDTIGIGEHRSEVTFEVGAVASESGYRMEGYDERKFLSNIENGFYPANMGVMAIGESPKGYQAYYASTELRDLGYQFLKFKEKYYKLG